MTGQPEWAQDYETVYRSLAKEYRELPAEQVDRLLVGVLDLPEGAGPGVGLVYAESFLGDIGRALGQVGKVVVKALPGAISGAISGAPAGLPGIIGGALIGGASSVLSGGKTPAVAPTGQAAAAPAAPGGGVAPAAPGGVATPAAPGGGATPAAPGGGATPAAPGGVDASAAPGGVDASAAPAGTPGAASGTPLIQLLTALSSPTVRDAITAMLLGGAGARTVPTATGTQVPVEAVTNMLETLSAQASAQRDALSPRRADYLAAESVDAVNPEARAAWLFGQLAPPEDLDNGFNDGWEDVDDDFEAQLEALAESDDMDYAGPGVGLDALLSPFAADYPTETVGRWWR